MSASDAHEQLVTVLASAHSVTNARHVRARDELLANLTCGPSTPTPNVHRPFTTRFIAGGLGLSALAASVALAFWLFSPISGAAAMERMAQALEQVTGYTYRMDKAYASRKGEGRTVRQTTQGSWRTSPAALRATMHIDEIVGTSTENPSPAKTTVELEEAHQANHPGILIDHLKKEFWYVQEGLTAASIPPSSPQVAVHMVQQRHGKVLKDLGTKTIGDRSARGLEITLDDAQPVSELGSTVSESAADGSPDFDWRNVTFEMWIDTQSNLPLEFRTVRRGEDFETTFEFHDLNWNVDFAADAFDLTPPADYTERKISPETDSQ